VALFAMQAAIEAFKTNEAAPDMNLKYMFKCIQDSPRAQENYFPPIKLYWPDIIYLRADIIF